MLTYKVKSCMECPFRNGVECGFGVTIDESTLDDMNMSCPVSQGVTFIADDGLGDDDDDIKTDDDEE